MRYNIIQNINIKKMNTMFAISYIAHNPSSTTLGVDDSFRRRAINLHDSIISLLSNDIPLEQQTEAALFVDLFEFRRDFIKENFSIEFLNEYSETLINESITLMNRNTRLALMLQNALDFSVHVAGSFIEKLQLLMSQPFNMPPYFKQWTEASLNMEIGMILGMYALENKVSDKQQSAISDFLKVNYENLEAFSLLMGFWDIPDNENKISQYMVNMRIVARTLKKQYPVHA